MAKLTIDESSLTAIGDALRVHFGENIEEGELLHWDSSPRVMAANYDEYGTEPNDGKGYLGPELYCKTYQIHGAARLKLDLSYRTEEGDFLWVAEGAHTTVNDNVGQKLEYTDFSGVYCSKCNGQNVDGTGIYRNLGYFDSQGFFNTQISGAELHVCQDCGALGYTYTAGIAGVFEYGLIDVQNYTTIFPSSGPLVRTIQSFEFEGDTFTFACSTWKEKSFVTGYYGYLYAYDADGNEIASYDLTFGRIPNTYTPGGMAYAISKLNNYPDAKEVPF